MFIKTRYSPYNLLSCAKVLTRLNLAALEQGVTQDIQHTIFILVPGRVFEPNSHRFVKICDDLKIEPNSTDFEW